MSKRAPFKHLPLPEPEVAEEDELEDETPLEIEPEEPAEPEPIGPMEPLIADPGHPCVAPSADIGLLGAYEILAKLDRLAECEQNPYLNGTVEHVAAKEAVQGIRERLRKELER
jgi:hypothetical protein